MLGQPKILFLDEIHRFNKAQQDAFLPHVESGLLTLIGATTENPSFEIIRPLLSRSRVLVLEPHTKKDVLAIVGRAAISEGWEKRLPLFRALCDPRRGLFRGTIPVSRLR